VPGQTNDKQALFSYQDGPAAEYAIKPAKQGMHKGYFTNIYSSVCAMSVHPPM
jgi:hypothetical protein